MPPSSSQREAGSAAHSEQQQVGKAGVLTSKFTGVCWNKKNKRWQASINSGGKYLYLGSFVQEDAAARMFDMAALKLRGRRTKTNFPLEQYLDENGELFENEELNSTIAVHEQLVLTQKMATAQALALAGLGTKKPRSAGGAGSVAKRMAKANPACQGIMSASTAATYSADGADGSVGGSAGAAAVPSLLDPQVLGQAIIAKHVSPDFDLPLLQQAATTAATSAALLQQQQQQQQQAASIERVPALGSLSSFGGLHAALTPQQQQQIAALLGQVNTESLLHPITSVHSNTGLVDHGTSLPSNWPSAVLPQQQQLALEQASAAAGLAVCQPPLVLHLPGGGMYDILEQQQEATRALQLAALEGFVKDIQQQQEQLQALHASSRPGSAKAVDAQMQHQLQQQQRQLQCDWPFMPEKRVVAAAVDQAATAAAGAAAAAGALACAQTAAADMADMLHPGCLPPVGGGYHQHHQQQHHQEQQQEDVSAGVAPLGSVHAAPPLSVVRLSQLACHLPPGGQLELLMVGEQGLCGVLYTMQDQQQPWATALWDGALWHNGGGFASEAAAMQACEFAVKFARQLVHKAPGMQRLQQQQQVSRSAAAAGDQAGSTEQLEERSSLDKLAAAAGQALDQMQQQQPSIAQQQQRHHHNHHQLQQQPHHGKHRSSASSQKAHTRKQYHLPSSHPQHLVQVVSPGAADAAAAAAEPVPPAAISAAKVAAEAARAAGTLAAAPAGLRPEAVAEQGPPQRGSAKRAQQPPQGQQPPQQQQQQQRPAVPDEECSLGSGLNSLLQMLQSDEVRSSLPAASLKVLDSLKAWGMGCAAALWGAGPLPDSGSAEALMFNILGSSSAAAFGQEAHLMMEQADAGAGAGLGPAASQGQVASPLGHLSNCWTAPSQGRMSPVAAYSSRHPQQQQQQQLLGGSEAATASGAAAPGAGFDAYGAFGSSDGMAAALAAAAAALEEPSQGSKRQAMPPAGPVPDASGSGVVAAAVSPAGSKRSTAGPSSAAQHTSQPGSAAKTAAPAGQLRVAASVAGSSSALGPSNLVQLAPSLHARSSTETPAGNEPVNLGAAAGELLSGSALGKLGAYLISLAEHEVQEQRKRRRSSRDWQHQEQQQAKLQRAADTGDWQVDKAKQWAEQPLQQQQQPAQLGDLAAVNWAAAPMAQLSPDDTHVGWRDATDCTAGPAAAQAAAAAAGGGAGCCSPGAVVPPGVLPASHHLVLSSPRLGEQQLPEAPHSPEPGSMAGRAAGAGQLPAKVSLDSHSSGSSSLAAAAAAVKAAACTAVLEAGSSKTPAAGRAPAGEAAAMQVDDHRHAGAAAQLLTAPAGDKAAAATAADGSLIELPAPLSSRLTETLTGLLSQGVEVNVQQVLALLSKLPQQQQHQKQ